MKAGRSVKLFYYDHIPIKGRPRGIGIYFTKKTIIFEHSDEIFASLEIDKPASEEAIWKAMNEAFLE